MIHHVFNFLGNECVVSGCHNVLVNKEKVT
jgi:hypothetical protein